VGHGAVPPGRRAAGGASVLPRIILQAGASRHGGSGGSPHRAGKWRDGERWKLGRFERPFVYFEDGRPAYLFGASADGPGCFTHASRTWNLGIPIVRES
jgi:hypothetical protein